MLALSAAGLSPVARLHGQSPGDESPTVSHLRQLAVLVLSFTVSPGHFAPLVFEPRSGWNTGVAVAGHKAFALHAFAPDGSWLKSVETPIAGSQRLLDRNFDTMLSLFNAAFEGPATVELQLFDLDGTPPMAPAGQPWRIAIPAYGTAFISLADLDWIPEKGGRVRPSLRWPRRRIGWLAWPRW